jgi:hypothetical protein
LKVGNQVISFEMNAMFFPSVETCPEIFSHTLIDLDFLIRFDNNGRDVLVSSKVLSEVLPDFFETFVNRAYREDRDEYTCKLRRGVKVTFVKR